MRYKVTAIKPVEILVKTRREEARGPLGGASARPAESFEWIFLSAGEARDGLDSVLGVLASYVPNTPAQLRLGKQTVLLPFKDTLPKVYHGLFELGHSAIPD
jgi:hypothetical protein